MRKKRVVIKNQPTFYHVVSRIVGRQFLIDAEGKEFLVKLFEEMEAFSGCKVHAYTVLDNHFHILLEVPMPEDLDDEALFKRMVHVYSSNRIAEIRHRIAHLREQGADDAADAELGLILARMYDLSEFMKYVKQSFTTWYNRQHARTGTLWEGRFKSIVVEGQGDPLLKIAAYIDLNCVRAGIVDDPKDYRWCSYAMAVAGKRKARAAITGIMAMTRNVTSAKHALASYRILLFGEGEDLGRDAIDGETLHPEGATRKRGFTREEAWRVYDAGGELPLHIILRCRIRCFTDGVAIGSKAELQRMFEGRKDLLPAGFFGDKRETGPRKTPVPGITSFRDLKLDPFG